jgi:hypothetical protein
MLSSINANKILKEKFGEEFHKSNGIMYMTQLIVRPEEQKELGVYDENPTPLY